MPPLASFSSEPDGGKGLSLWLKEIGYFVRTDAPVTYLPPPGVGLALLLEPTERITESEWETLDVWIDDGGALLLAGNGFLATEAIGHFGFALNFIEESTGSGSIQTPLLTSPVVEKPVRIETKVYLVGGADALPYVVHLADGTSPVVLSFEKGDGLVILSSDPSVFSNAGLKVDGVPEFTLNLVAAAAARTGAVKDGVWFDEWHHGIRTASETRIGLSQWLLHTPTGQALLFAAAVIYVALLLQGRPFGKPVPIPKSSARRTPLEYITALANLSRKAGHRADVLNQYYLLLKRGLGHRYRIRADLPDEEWVAHLSRVYPELPQQELLTLLQSLRKAPGSEAELVSLARQAAGWIERYSE
jgi:hypothetical protein